MSIGGSTGGAMRSPGVVHAALAGIASGLLMLASMPPAPAWFLAWIALTPLIAVCVRLSRASTAFASGLICGLVFFTGCTYWTVRVMTNFGGLSTSTGVAVAAVLILYLSLFPALFSVLLRRAASIWPVWWPLAAPLLWAGLEHLRTVLFTGFPWCLFGYSQIAFLPAAQAASIGGVTLVSALLVAGSAGICAAFHRLRVPAVATCATVVFATVGGWISLRSDLGADGQSALRVGVVQPCAPPLFERIDDVAESMATHVELSRRLAGVDLIVWPENSLLRNVSTNTYFRHSLEQIVDEVGAPVLVNSIEDAGGRVYNSAVLVSARREGPFPRYDKRHLVPFGEYVPLRSVLFFAGKILREVQDFSPGERRELFDVAGCKLASAICYEIIYPGEVAAFVRDGAQVLVTQSNDTWYGDTVMPHQHQAMAAFRAIENRRYLVRVTNSGISSVVDPAGHTVIATALNEPAAIAATVRASSRLSIYSRSHDALAWIGVLIVLILAVRRGSRSSPQTAQPPSVAPDEPPHIISGGSG